MCHAGNSLEQDVFPGIARSGMTEAFHRGPTAPLCSARIPARGLSWSQKL